MRISASAAGVQSLAERRSLLSKRNVRQPSPRNSPERLNSEPLPLTACKVPEATRPASNEPDNNTSKSASITSRTNCSPKRLFCPLQLQRGSQIPSSQAHTSTPALQIPSGPVKPCLGPTRARLNAGPAYVAVSSQKNNELLKTSPYCALWMGQCLSR